MSSNVMVANLFKLSVQDNREAVIPYLIQIKYHPLDTRDDLSQGFENKTNKRNQRISSHFSTIMMLAIHLTFLKV